VDDETLLLLLKGGHLDMPDRIARGIWPHAPISFDSLVAYLANVLERGDVWFPCRLEPQPLDEPIREGGTIERQEVDRYVYRARTHHAASPATLSRCVEMVFTSARAAALHYLKWDLNLPGDLDGWKVLK
jgi:hypothetical protein